MAAPKVKFKRSSVADKRPSLANLELGELALNTYDGKLFTRQDTSGVGIATTVTVLNPWDENYGGGSITYAGIVTSGSGGISTDYTEITVSGLSPSTFNQTYVRQATGFVLDTGTISSGNALFKADSNYYYYVASTGIDAEDRIVIYSEEDGGWMTLFDFDDPDFREGNISDNQAVGSSFIFSAALTTNSDTFNGRNVPDASDSNVTYGTTSGITTSRVGVVTITQDGHAQYAGVVTAYSFSGDVTGNLTGNVAGNLTGTVLTASQTNITSVGTLGSLAVTNNITVGGTVDGRDVATDGSNQDNLQTLTGVSAGSTTLGTFTGTTISDNKDLKEVLQELETALDNVVGGNSGAASVLTQSDSTDATFFPTFVSDNNGSATQESFKTDAGISYNPSTNILTVSGSVSADVTGDLTGNVSGNVTGDVTGTASTANTLKTVNTPVVNANHFITFVDTNNSTAIAETFKTDNGLYYNPYLNQFNAFGVNTGVLSLNGVDVTTTAAELNFLDGATAGTAVGSKAVVLDANKDISGLNNVSSTTFTGSLTGNATSADKVKTLRSTSNSDFHITFVADNNAIQTAENVLTDGELTYNPSTNKLTATELAATIFELNGTNITANATEINKLDGVTATTAELNRVDVTAGTASASKALVVDTNRSIENLGVVTATTFSGDLTGNVTGNVVGNVTGNATGLSGNPSINVADIIATGNVSIAGTLTYEDVTSIDAIGIVTARTGVRVTSGGIVVSNGGIDVTGVSTFTNDISIADKIVHTGDTNTGIRFPASDTFTIITNGNERLRVDSNGDVGVGIADPQERLHVARVAMITGNTPQIRLNADDSDSSDGDRTMLGQATGNGNFVSTAVDNDTILRGTSTGSLIFGIGTVERLRVHSSGNIGINKTNPAEKLDVGGIIKTQGLNVTSTSTFTGAITANGGLAGDVTGDVTGTATTATNAVQLQTARTIAGVSFDGTSDISLNNNAITNGAGYITTSFTNTNQLTNGAGFITNSVTGDFSVTGNISVGGTLTYEDVTNVDSIGVITARSGLNVTGGQLVVGAGFSVHQAGIVTANGFVGPLTGDVTGTASNATNLNGQAASYYLNYNNLSNTPTLITNNNQLTNGAGYITTSFVNTNQLVNGAGFITASDDITGNAATATALETARTIGGVSFDGTGNINLPGVNTSGNQDTSGNAATATQLATARTIAGVSFDGTSDISLNNNAITNGAGYITTSFTNTSQLTNDAGFITTSFTSYNQLSDTPTIPTNNNELTNGAGYITTSFTNTNQLTNGAGFITNSVTGDFSVSGNISIGGTLTYEDVTNVDSVGVVTARSGVKVPDNQKINLGNSDDLQIYHDGSHSYIADAGTGNLRVRAGTIEITNLAGNKTSANFNSATGQELFYNNTKRFETTNTGVTITGALTAGGLVYPSTDGTANQVLVTDGSGNLSFADPSVSTGIITTTTTNETSIDNFSSTTYSTGIYHIQATRGGEVELTNFKVIHNGTTTFITEFGTISTGPGIATYSADINSGNVRLLAYPSSSDSTVFQKKRTLIETGSTPAGSTTTTSTSTTNIDTLSTVNKAVVYEIEVTRGTAVHLTTINLVHDGTSAFISEFGTVKSGNSLATFDADISGSTIRLRATPTTSDSTSFNVNRTVIS